ncbi:MAG: tetratricopeptide repeat protein [Bacteroidetes bacterium]|nr:tetratricopeptide repeat protein [Bacteroidota bacterium]MDA0929803.1 tetratricopeptide repeat protein [Bacteroidota bacterium]
MLRITFLLCVLVWFGCDSARNVQYKELSALREKIMEDNINGLTGPAQRSLWMDFSSKAMAFYRAYPTDSSAPSLLFNAAELYFKANEADSALMAVGILDSFPQFSRKPDLLYLRGQIHQMLFLDYDKAEQYFSQLVQEYPNHPASASAITSLAVLKTLNEVEADSLEFTADSLPYQP